MSVLIIKEPAHEPPILTIAAAAANIAARRGLTIRLTRGPTGRHGAWSLHYRLSALDFGSKEFASPLKQDLLADFKTELGPQYDCILEGAGTDTEHYHIEFDPKK